MAFEVYLSRRTCSAFCSASDVSRVTWPARSERFIRPATTGAQTHSRFITCSSTAAVIISPLVTGTLGEKVGWHWGFGAAGVGMLIGLAIYLAGRKYLPPDSPVVEKHDEETSHSTRTERRSLRCLLLLPVITIAIIANQQIFNAYLVWAEKTANLPIFFGKQMPTTWLITLDASLSVSCLAGAVVFWRLWSKKFREPAEITKLGIGSLIAVTGFLSSASGRPSPDRTDKVSIGWLITFHLLNSIGFANVFPVSIALYARVAPAALVRYHHRYLLSGVLCRK